MGSYLPWIGFHSRLDQGSQIGFRPVPGDLGRQFTGERRFLFPRGGGDGILRFLPGSARSVLVCLVKGYGPPNAPDDMKLSLPFTLPLWVRLDDGTILLHWRGPIPGLAGRSPTHHFIRRIRPDPLPIHLLVFRVIFRLRLGF